MYSLKEVPKAVCRVQAVRISPWGIFPGVEDW